MSSVNQIHPTAVVSESAVLGEGNSIGPYSVIGPGVHLGSRNWVGPHVVLGTPAEHRRFHDEQAAGRSGELLIGDDNIFHELAVVQFGTDHPTVVGSRCMLMAKTNVGHDCVLEDDATLAPGVILAGHVTVCRSSTVGMGAMVHQGIRIGDFAMVGMGTVVTRPVPPFALVANPNARLVQLGLNEVGIDRAGLSGDWTERYAELISGELSDEGLPAEVRDALSKWKGMRP